MLAPGLRRALGRLALTALLSAAVATSTPTGAHADVAPDAPVAVRYSALLDAALAALPADPATARDDLRRAESLAATSALDPVVRALDNGDVARAQALLRDETAALHLPPGARGEDPDAARHTLDQVYARPPLDGLDRPRAENPLARLLRWFEDLLNRLPSGTENPWGLVATGAVVLALLLAALRLLRGAGARATTARAAPGTAPPADADAEWAAAERAAAGGDHREAIRRAYRSALLDLVARGRLPVEPAWTTGDLLRRSAGDPGLRAALAPAAAAFDDAWYGGRRPGAQEWERARAACTALRELARDRAREGVAG